MRRWLLGMIMLVLLALAGCGEGDLTRPGQESALKTESTPPLDATAQTQDGTASPAVQPSPAAPTATLSSNDIAATHITQLTASPVTAADLTATAMSTSLAPDDQGATQIVPLTASPVTATALPIATDLPSQTPAPTTAARATPSAMPVAGTSRLAPMAAHGWPEGTRDVWLPESVERFDAEEQVVELPAEPGVPARRLRIPLRYHASDDPGHVIRVSIPDGSGWREVSGLRLPDEIDRPDLLRPTFIEPGRRWLMLEGASGPTTCWALLSLRDTQLQLHYSHCGRWVGAEVYDLDGDGIGELITIHRHYAGPGAPITTQHIDAYVWSDALGDLEPFTPQPLSTGLDTEPLARLNRAVALARGGLWKDALALVETLPEDQLRDRPALLTARLILLNGQQRQELVQRVTTDVESGGSWPHSFYAQLDYGNYAGALKALRTYAPEEIFELNSNLTANMQPEAFTRYADEALQASPELAAAHYVRAIGLALSHNGSAEVTESLRRAVELAPDEPLFQQGLDYWLHRTP